MRAWPAKFDGLRLRLSAGWYSIPSYIGADERRLLIAVLAAGIAEVDHIVELDWDVLEEAADKLQLTRSLVFVRVPAEVEPDGEALQRVRATLGSVRLGLLQYEAPGVWADVAWQEREVKAPLLTWLKRWLRNPAHPFAKLGIANLSIDEIAKLTAEPTELLMMTEMVVRHRLRYRQQGMTLEDWLRSIAYVAAERLAGRLMQIPAELRLRVLDLAMSSAAGPLLAALEDRDAGLALARVGLAWHGGNDLLLGPLLRLVQEPVVLRRLLDLLPEEVWSEAGRQWARRAMQVFLPPPRAALIAPDPEYSEWPAIVAQFPGDALNETGGPEDTLEVQDLLNEIPYVFWRIGTYFDLPSVRAELFASKVFSHYPPAWRAAIDTSFAMLEEISDRRLVELDFQRGRIHRFDAVGRAWADQLGGQGASAYFRWVALTRLLGHAHDKQRLDVLEGELDHALESDNITGDLRAALLSLRGDIWARRNRYRCALKCWEMADRKMPWLSAYRLKLRQSLALLRLDRFDAAEDLDEMAAFLPSYFRYSEVPEEDRLAHDVVKEVVRSTNALRTILESGTPNSDSSLVEPPSESHRARITRIAAALEYGDWPHAINLAKQLDPDLSTGEGIRAELLRAWITASLGDLDRAHASFAQILQLTTERGDTLAQAFARRGLAGVAHLRNQSDSAIASLEAAVKLERELELPDAELLELELIGWRVLAGQLTLEAYNAKLANFDTSSASPSLEFARLDAFLRFLGAARTVIHTTDADTLRVAMHPFIDTLTSCVRLREVSPRVRPAGEVAVELAARLAEAGMHEEAKQVREAIEAIAPDRRALIAH